MRRNIPHVIAFVIITLSMYIQWSYMQKISFSNFNAYESNNINSWCIIAIILIFVLSLFGSFRLPVVSFGRNYLVSYLCIIILSVIHSSSVPMDSGVLPFLIVCPAAIFCLSYDYTNKQSVPSSLIVFFFLAYTFIIINNFSNRTLVYAQFIDNEQDFISSSAYTLLYLLPFALLLNKKILKIVFVTIVGVALTFSFKRTGIISYGLGIITYLLVNRNKYKKHLFRSMISLAIIALAVYIYLSSVDISFLVDRFQSLSTDGGSGRTDVYAKVFKMISESDIVSIFFGHGWNAVAHKSGMPAHNDFFEIIYDFGWPVFFVYLNFVIKIFAFARKIYKQGNPCAAPMFASLVIFMCGSSFSHILLYPQYMIPFAMFWGGISGSYKSINKTNKTIVQ